MRGVVGKIFLAIALGAIGAAFGNHFIQQTILESKMTAEQAAILAASQQVYTNLTPIFLLVVLLFGIALVIAVGSRPANTKFKADLERTRLERRKVELSLLEAEQRRLEMEETEERPVFARPQRKAIKEDQIINL